MPLAALLVQAYLLSENAARNAEQQNPGSDHRQLSFPPVLQPVIVKSRTFSEILFFDHVGRTLQGGAGQRIVQADEAVDLPCRFPIISRLHVRPVSRVKQHGTVFGTQDSPCRHFDGTESFGRTVAEQLRSGPRTHSGDCCVAEYGLLDTAQQIFGNANRIGYDVQRGEITEAFLCQRFVMRIVGQFERHRTVAARPGQVIHPQCRGCHAQ